ncbi:MAG TPA: hypothetical protein DDX54_02110 [Rhodospirillaceae bacterium]|nr:hypothetical protein [Rhodospirillaceae bacterium]
MGRGRRSRAGRSPGRAARRPVAAPAPGGPPGVSGQLHRLGGGRRGHAGRAAGLPPRATGP